MQANTVKERTKHSQQTLQTRYKDLDNIVKFGLELLSSQALHCRIALLPTHSTRVSTSSCSGNNIYQFDVVVTLNNKTNSSL